MVNIGFMACFDREHFPSFEKFAFESDQTLLEYDIVLWDMAFLHFGYNLEHGNRVRELKRLLRDRRRRLNEIEALMKNGKSIVILSPDPDAFYFETEKNLLRSDADSEIERTLQSEKITQNFIDIYSFLPPDIEERVRGNAVVARGKKMDFSGDAAFTEAWKILKDMAWYNSYFLKPIGTPFLYVKGTQYPVASWLRYSNGNIFFVPGTEYDDSSDYPVFVEVAKILVNAVDRLSGNTVDLFWPDNDFGVPLTESPALVQPTKEQSERVQKDFFISYNSVDHQWAEWIAWQLEEAGYTTVLQAWDFLPGNNFVLEMHRAARGTERTIAVLSQAYLDAPYTQSEWAAAFAQDPMGEKGKLLPVRVQECDLEGLLPQIVYIDLVGLDEAVAKDALLIGVRRERAKPTTAPAFPRIERRTVVRPERYPGEVTVPFRADIRLKVIRQDFSSSIGISIPDPRPRFRGVKWNPRGHDKQGMPDCGSLWARIEITNVGLERGLLEWEPGEAELPPLFDADQIHFSFFAPTSVEGRRLPFTTDLFVYIPFTEQDPQAFAQAMRALIESQARYKITIRYWTKGVEGESETRKLPIEGNFQGFYQKLLEHWDGFGFKDLADLARLAES